MRQFMMELALYMSKTGNYEIHYKDLKRLISKSLSDRLFSYYDLEDFDQKIRTCSFLHRDPEGNYSFIHRSFMEYFVALGVREAFETSGDIEQIQKILAGVEMDEPIELFVGCLKLSCPSCGETMHYYSRDNISSNTRFDCLHCTTRIALERDGE